MGRRETNQEELRQLYALAEQLTRRLGELIAEGPETAAAEAAGAGEHEGVEETLTLQEIEATPPSRPEAAAPILPPPTVPVARPSGGGMALFGRSLMALGGAFLLRALTEGGTLPELAGVLAALAYAIFWLVAIGRQRTDRLSAFHHGLVAATVAYPLLWEATTRFAVLGPIGGGLGLLAVCGTAMVVARRRGYPEIAGLHLAGGLVAALLLAWATGRPASYVACTLGLGTILVWLGGDEYWSALRGVAAIAADIGVLHLTRGAETSLPEDWMVLLTLQLALLLLYLGSYGAQAVLERRSVQIFEAVQSALVILVGYRGAALVVGHGSGAASFGLAALSLVLAALGYWIAFRSAGLEGQVNFFYFSSLGLVFGIFGSGLLLGQPEWGWAPLAMGVAALAHRSARRTLILHSALLVAAAAASSGLLWLGWCGLLGSPSGPWPVVTAAALLVLAAAAICVGIPVRGRRPWGALARLPQAILLLILAWGSAGVLLRTALPLLGGSEAIGAAALAMARTAILAVAAVLLALAAAHSRRLEAASWLVYPVLVAGGLKLVLEDLRQGRAATLFVALALYGGALVAVSKILPKKSTDE